MTFSKLYLNVDMPIILHGPAECPINKFRPTVVRAEFNQAWIKGFKINWQRLVTPKDARRPQRSLMADGNSCQITENVTMAMLFDWQATLVYRLLYNPKPHRKQTGSLVKHLFVGVVQRVESFFWRGFGYYRRLRCLSPSQFFLNKLKTSIRPHVTGNKPATNYTS